MRRSNPSKQEIVDDQLTEDTVKLQQISLREETATCHVCGTDLQDGARCTAVAVRVADQPTVQIAHLKCPDCRHEPTEHLTRGVRDLILDGRIGTCTAQATQSSWPVLLAPQPRAVSPADTTELHPVPGATVVRQPIACSDHYTAADDATERHPWQRAVVRTDRRTRDHPSTDTDSETDTNSTPTDVGHDTAHDEPSGGPHR